MIADWLLPDGEGLDLLRSEPARAMPPVVIMTSHGSERVAVEAIRAGAVDYVVKSEMALADLPHMAERAVRHRRVEEALGDLVAGTAAAGGRGPLRRARAAPGEGAAGQVRLGGRARGRRAGCGRSPASSTAASCPTSSTRSRARPCAGVLDGSVCHIRDGVAERYPGDEGLRRIGRAELRRVGAARLDRARSWASSTPSTTGPLDEVVRPEGVLQVFAARAAAEIERLRAEREIERQRVFADSLLDMVASLVIVVDPHGRIVRFNRACEQASGWTEAELRGRAFWEVLRPAETRAGGRALLPAAATRCSSCPRPSSPSGRPARASGG